MSNKEEQQRHETILQRLHDIEQQLHSLARSQDMLDEALAGTVKVAADAEAETREVLMEKLAQIQASLDSISQSIGAGGS